MFFNSNTDGVVLFPKHPPYALAAPMLFKRDKPVTQSNAFSQPQATATAILDVKTDKMDTEDEQTVGVRCDSVTLTPHCHGTHTEGAGHITKQPITLDEILAGEAGKFYKTAVITVKPVLFSETDNTHPYAKATDYVITDAAIKNAIENLDKPFSNEIDALVVRCDHKDYLTTPNIVFDEPNPAPFYTLEGMTYISQMAKHHLTNLPSLDPAVDEGTLLNHVRFFKCPTSRNAQAFFDETDHSILPQYKRTNTEFCYIPPEVQDGYYALQLGTQSHWQLDAVPANPLLYPLQKCVMQLR